MPDSDGFKRRNHWLLIMWGGAILAVVLYNSWRVCCGQCSLRDMTVIPWSGWFMVAINLLAAAILWHVRRRNRKPAQPYLCANCCTTLQPDWPYCPSCGNQRRPEDN